MKNLEQYLVIILFIHKFSFDSFKLKSLFHFLRCSNFLEHHLFLVLNIIDSIVEIPEDAFHGVIIFKEFS